MKTKSLNTNLSLVLLVLLLVLLQVLVLRIWHWGEREKSDQIYIFTNLITRKARQVKKKFINSANTIEKKFSIFRHNCYTQNPKNMHQQPNDKNFGKKKKIILNRYNFCKMNIFNKKFSSRIFFNRNFIICCIKRVQIFETIYFEYRFCCCSFYQNAGFPPMCRKPNVSKAH